MGLHRGVDSVLESSSGVLGPGDGGGDLGQELEEESKKGDYSTSVSLRICGVGWWGIIRSGEMGVDSN